MATPSPATPATNQPTTQLRQATLPLATFGSALGKRGRPADAGAADEPAQKRKGKCNWVWDQFTAQSDADSRAKGQNPHKCKHCGHVASGCNVTRLKEHLLGTAQAISLCHFLETAEAAALQVRHLLAVDCHEIMLGSRAVC